MELRQYRRILTARKKYLGGIIVIDFLAIIASALFCDYFDNFFINCIRYVS